MIVQWNSFKHFFRNCFAVLAHKVPAQRHPNSRGGAEGSWLREELSHRALRDAEVSEAPFLYVCRRPATPLRKPLLSPPLASRPLPHCYSYQSSTEPSERKEWAMEKERGLCELAFNKPSLVADPALTHVIWFSFSVFCGGTAGK